MDIEVAYRDMELRVKPRPIDLRVLGTQPPWCNSKTLKEKLTCKL